MPYIPDNEGNRGLLEPECLLARGPGDLHYQIACLLRTYLTTNGKSYRTINDIMGVLSCAQQEFYRRIAIPYEDEKRVENGDVY